MKTYNQSLLFPDIKTIPRPVNVASVPQRSPFRYPGGKTWFVPTFRHWVTNLNFRPQTLVEPFAGGAIISLTGLFENYVDNIVMAELDEDVAAVWQALVNGDAVWLANRMLSFNLTPDTLTQELDTLSTSIKEKAFQTILKNRTSHGGILAQGAGLLKHGESGKGILSRWYPETIAKRLLNIHLIRNRIDFRHADGLSIIEEFASKPDVIFFIDPPYTAGGKKAGKRLYKYNALDHEQLFSLCETIQGDFLMTYDNANEVKELARKHGFQMRLIPMTNTHHATMEELVIGKNLQWLDLLPEVHEPKLKYGRSKKVKAQVS